MKKKMYKSSGRPFWCGLKSTRKETKNNSAIFEPLVFFKHNKHWPYLFYLPKQ
jgi:hypothetical protein